MSARHVTGGPWWPVWSPLPISKPWRVQRLDTGELYKGGGSLYPRRFDHAGAVAFAAKLNGMAGCRSRGGINAARQRAKVVSTVDVSGPVTEAPVLLPVGAVAVRQAAAVLSGGSFPWISPTVAGRVLASRRKA